IPGKTYHVNMVSMTGCPTVATGTLQTMDVALKDTAICSGQPGNIILNATPLPGSAAGVYAYSWSGPGGFISSLQNPVIPFPSQTSVYTLKVTNTNGCSVTKAM